MKLNSSFPFTARTCFTQKKSVIKKKKKRNPNHSCLAVKPCSSCPHTPSKTGKYCSLLRCIFSNPMRVTASSCSMTAGQNQRHFPHSLALHGERRATHALSLCQKLNSSWQLPLENEDQSALWHSHHLGQQLADSRDITPLAGVHPSDVRKLTNCQSQSLVLIKQSKPGIFDPPPV